MRDLKKADKACFTNGMTAKPCKHPELDKKLRCKTCGVLVDIREKKNKYGARRTVVDGLPFDSLKEARRYEQLKAMEQAGEITGLVAEKKRLRFALTVKRVLIGMYTADFFYFAKENGVPNIPTWEDAKSEATRKARDYPLRKKLMLAIHGIEIREV